MTLHCLSANLKKKRADWPINQILSTSMLRISDFGPIFYGIVNCKGNAIKCDSFWMQMLFGYLSNVPRLAIEKVAGSCFFAPVSSRLLDVVS